MPEPAGRAELRAIYCLGRVWHLRQFARHKRRAPSRLTPGNSSLLSKPTSASRGVGKLDPLERSVVGLSSLLAHTTKHGWSLVALDLKIDSTTYTGRMVLHLLAALAEWGATDWPNHQRGHRIRPRELSVQRRRCRRVQLAWQPGLFRLP